MHITEIVELSKSRSKVYIDHEFAFVLYKGELRLYHVREGHELDSKDYQTIMEEVLPKRAKLRAMNLLQSREYTTAQLRKKLEMGLYPEPVIREALEYVASYHYTDDLRYAVSYITCHEDTRSRKRIEQDLLAKGVPREMLEEAWTTWENSGGIQDELSMISKLLEKKHYDPAQADIKETRKMIAFLARKGYGMEQIRKVIRNNYIE